MLLPLHTGFSKTERDFISPFLLNNDFLWVHLFLLLLHLFDGRLGVVSMSGIPSFSLSSLAKYFHSDLFARFLPLDAMNFPPHPSPA